MNKDDFDIVHDLKRYPTIKKNTLDLINGLQNRAFGFSSDIIKSNETIELFGEEQLVRKTELGEMRCEMPGLPRSTFLMVFSPDGSRVASTHGNHNIYVTDIRSGKNIKTLIGHPRTPWCIAFHPTSDQIVASGCLGGQVRIWDLSGGSEVWTVGGQSVIASIAFHPNDRILVIATYNEVYFWDWSQPEPFVHAATSNPKEKVRYVAFDKLGHKLITGIANSPQTRWERVRAPVPVPRQERCASPYRRRITQRLVNLNANINPSQHPPTSDGGNERREPLLGLPERERRITVCYRNLVREYEQLVQRYLQLYRPPTMIDRGTDPMEPNPWFNNRGSQTRSSEPSTSGTNSVNSTLPGPSNANPYQSQSVPTDLSNHQCEELSQPGPSCSSSVPREQLPSTISQSSQPPFHNLITPSRIFSVVKKSNMQSTQTTESRKHKAEEAPLELTLEKRFKKASNIDLKKTSSNLSSADSNAKPGASTSQGNEQPGPSTCQTGQSQVLERSTQTLYPRRLWYMNYPRARRRAPPAHRILSRNQRAQHQQEAYEPLNLSTGIVENESRSQDGQNNQNNVDELMSNIRRTVEEEVRNRMLPIVRSVPANDRPELIRLFEHSRENVRMRFRQYSPMLTKTAVRRPSNRVVTTSDSSSSDEEPSNLDRPPHRNLESAENIRGESPSGASSANTSSNIHETPRNPTASTSVAVNVRNFNTELEQLVTSLLGEIQRTENSPQSETPMTDGTLEAMAASNINPVSFQPSAPLPEPPRRHFIHQVVRPLLRTGVSSPGTSSSFAPTETPVTIVNTNTSTTNSTIYTSPTIPRRARYSLHRGSAFMPLRVNYTRAIRGRRGRLSSLATAPLDELINYSERDNAEDDPPPPQRTFYPVSTQVPTSSAENRIRDMYSTIVQDLQLSLTDVRNIRASNRPGETSDILSSLSERLENITNQSDTILRNLAVNMETLTNTTDQAPRPPEPSWSFFDQNFYVRDQRRNLPTEQQSSGESLNPSNLFPNGSQLSSVNTDHTYPRTSETSQGSTQTDNMSPLMASVYLTISHIQRQARLLRQQVESIERIDRTMLEVAQVQVTRQIIIELINQLRIANGETRSTGMSSVRQMMAGTRISDSAPNDSPSDAINSTQNNQQSQHPSTSSENPSTSSDQANAPPQTRRSSNRKTYPPSRLFRLSRQQGRRSSIVHIFRRCMNRGDRNFRQASYGRSGSGRAFQEAFPPGHFPSFSTISSPNLAMMSRRLENLLSEQIRIFTGTEVPANHGLSTSRIDLREHILTLRLHGCALRMNRIVGTTLGMTTFSNIEMDPTAAVTQDGTSRYGCRHTMSLIVDGISRYMETAGASNIPPIYRQQMHGVLAMSLLLTELLLLLIVESIPPPSGMNLDPERESLTTRIDQMCSQMLQSRFSGHSHQLTKSLRLMRLTMRIAHGALGQTYSARRNAMLPRTEAGRRPLDFINRCLRSFRRRQMNSNSNPAQETSENNGENPYRNGWVGNNNFPYAGWWNSVSDLISRHSNNTRDADNIPNQPSTSTGDRVAPQGDPVSSTNENSDNDDQDDESDWYRNSSANNSNSYRSNTVNLSPNNENSNQQRSWNVPSVQVNDVPISEPVLFQRLMSQRQRLRDRYLELGFNPPAMGLLRPRFLHPLYASVNPFDADLEESQREQIYDSDMITTVTPNHRIQVWDISNWNIPAISNSGKNIVVNECKIHNDASVDVAKDGTILVTLLPSGGYLNVTNRLGVYSLKWETLGQCLYVTSFEQSAVSVSLSPLSRHLVVGLASRRVSIAPTDRWVMARIFKIEQKDKPGERLPVLRELEQNRDSRINCIRWLPTSGQGLIYATNTGQLVILT